jgi:hypothetical protein
VQKAIKQVKKNVRMQKICNMTRELLSNGTGG